MIKNLPFKPLFRQLLKKSKGLLMNQPLQSMHGRRHRFLDIEGFYIVESHQSDRRTFLNILDRQGRTLFRSQYLPWNVQVFANDDLGWLVRFFSLQNGAFLGKEDVRQTGLDADEKTAAPLQLSR